jgi:hypothetical protein
VLIASSRKKTVRSDHGDYDYSSPVPDTQPTRNIISNREIRGLDIPARTSARKHSAVSLPLNEDDIIEAEAAVRPYNTKFGALWKKYGYTAVIDTAFRDAKKAQHPLTDPAKSLGNVTKWRRYGLPLLASSHEDVMQCLYGEGIAPQVALRDSLRTLFESSGDNVEGQSKWMQRYSQVFAPCLYVLELVDSDKQAPTPTEGRRVIELLRQYVSGDDQFATQNAEIDSLSRTVDATEDDIKEGFHFFLGGHENRAAKILTFCTALETLLENYAGIANDLPLPWTFKYVGYANKASHHFANYSQDSNQSWFSELLRNVFRYLDPDRGFQLDSHVIFFCAHPDECKIGEELVSRSAQAYFDSGTGMGVAAAGVNVNSSNTDDLKAADAERMWQLTMKFRLRGEFARNMDRHEEYLELYAEYVENVIKQRAAAKDARKADKDAVKNARKSDKADAKNARKADRAAAKEARRAKKEAKRAREADHAAKSNKRAKIISDEKQAIAKLRSQIAEDRDKMLAIQARVHNHVKVDNSPEVRNAIDAIQTLIAAEIEVAVNALAYDPRRRAASREL